MTIVILGAGRVGLELARQLIDEKKEVVIIEKDSQWAQNVSRQLDCMIINDNGNSIEGLQKAGVENADFFVSVSESDEINMISCALVSSTFEKPVTIARVRNLDYSRTWDKRPDFLGINFIINPEIEVARSIVRTIEHGAVSSVIDFDSSNLQMRSIQIEEGSPFDNAALPVLRQQITVPFIIAAISRNGAMIIPGGETILHAGDQIWILANTVDFEKILDFMQKPQVFLKDIVLAGGGNIGLYICQYLLKDAPEEAGIFKRFFKKFIQRKKRTVHLVEKNYHRCKELADMFPGIEVTNADISEDQVLEEGRFSSYDLLITATGSQDLNIVTAAHAKTIGIPRTLALVKKRSTAAVAQTLGIDVAISINETLVNSIQKIIRRKYARNVYNFSDSNLEILELTLEAHRDFIGKAIKDIKLPKGNLIIMVSRDEENIIPQADTVLETNDHLMILTTKENIREFE